LSQLNKIQERKDKLDLIYKGIEMKKPEEESIMPEKTSS